MVVFPLPEGPKRTVQGCVRESLTLSETTPILCSMLVVRRGADGSLDNFGLPSIGPSQSG